MKKLLTSSLMLIAVLALVAPASAAIILQDGFDGYGSDTVLHGQTAPNGNTWNGSTGGGLNISTSYGRGTTKGVGESPTGFVTGTEVDLTKMQGSDPDPIMVVEADVHKSGAGWRGQTRVFLYDDVAATSIGFRWGPGGSGYNIETEAGLGLAATSNSVGVHYGWLYCTLTVDLSNKTVGFSWYDPDDPTDPNTTGSVNVGTYSVAFAPHRMKILAYGGGGGVYNGLDNLSITTVPEPVTLAVLGIGALLAVLRRRQ